MICTGNIHKITPIPKVWKKKIQSKYENKIRDILLITLL